MSDKRAALAQRMDKLEAMQMTKLKPCPFCGSAAKRTIKPEEDTAFPGASFNCRISCPCGVEMVARYCGFGAEDPKKAAQSCITGMWNMRRGEG